MNATILGDAEDVRVLLDGGADPNARLRLPAEHIPMSFTPQARDITMSGGTALMLAAEFGHASVARVLVERGADRGVRANVGGQNIGAADIARGHGNRLVLSVVEHGR